jgi:lipopolysaccharide heptosyltransferase II
MKIKSKKKILVVKICCIGDIVQSIPLLRTIKKNEPNSTITYVATTWCSQLVEMIPEVDDIIIFDAPYEKNLFIKIFQSLKFGIKLFISRFDVALNLHRTNVWNLFFYFTLIKKRVGFGESTFLTDRVDFKGTIHESKRYLALLENFNYSRFDEIPVIEPSRKILDPIETALKEKGFKKSDKIITIYPDGGVNPGTEMQIKQLSLEKYLELIQVLSEKYPDSKFVIMRSKEAKSKADDIYEKIDKHKSIYLSNLTLQQLAGWFRCSSVVIGGDTGLLHMAAATGTPVIMFFGPSSPEYVAPLENKHKIIYRNIDCAPCYTPETVQDKNNFAGNSFVCKRGDVLCMSLISVEEIIAAVDEVFSPSGEGVVSDD